MSDAIKINGFRFVSVRHVSRAANVPICNQNTTDIRAFGPSSTSATFVTPTSAYSDCNNMQSADWDQLGCEVVLFSKMKL